MSFFWLLEKSIIRVLVVVYFDECMIQYIKFPEYTIKFSGCQENLVWATISRIHNALLRV